MDQRPVSFHWYLQRVHLGPSIYEFIVSQKEVFNLKMINDGERVTGGCLCELHLKRIYLMKSMRRIQCALSLNANPVYINNANSGGGGNICVIVGLHIKKWI